ncbi:predicted protein [Uncinocarpus reesii 1704]|uniref:Uncharacterized protein n=1 Tax=Uncinocarpus reesii (strain UAMH 1704) TaxID=336963 RepID=C4JQ37_UNCRE|nr:uncharacterized protein UREG_03270 [Uncinocarpus reesii 1704]EEP78424.1 predicted protein [Uncinocarpus reesii 1704]
MLTATSKACRLPGNIRLKPALAPFVRHSRTSPIHRRELSCSVPQLPRAQLLRYALTGSTAASAVNGQLSQLDTQLDQLFSTPLLPKGLDESSNREIGSPFRFRAQHGHILSSIQSEIETKITDKRSGDEFVGSFPLFREALGRCENATQWEDLIATINGTLARLQKLNVINTRELLLLGMNYAAQCFSVPALRHYFKRYSEGGYEHLSPETANQLVNSLTKGLEMRILDNPSIDKNKMRQVIMGTNSSDSGSGAFHSLLDISHPSENAFLGAYVNLLGDLGEQKGLSEIWQVIRAQFVRSRQTTHLKKAAANCLQAMVKSGNPQAAIEAARDVSRQVDLNSFFPVHLWGLLIQHDQDGVLCGLPIDKTVQSVLDRELRVMEMKLGVRWSGKENGSHSYVRDTPVWCNNGSPEDVYEWLGTSNMIPAASHLLDLFGVANSSRSIASISSMADLLNEYEGVEIPLCMAQNKQFGQLELAWITQCSPIEITQDKEILAEEKYRARQLSSLGLLRVRQDCNGVPRKVGPHVHLMQVGYVAMRRKSTLAKSGLPTAEPEQWTPTGHVIGWDRRNGKLVFLWVGKGYGAMKAGLVQPKVSSCLPHACAEVRNLVELKNSIEGKRSLETDVSALGLDEMFKNTTGLWIDVDPCFDLQT